MTEPLWSDEKIDGEFRSSDKLWAFVMREEYEAELEHGRMLLREAERRITEQDQRIHELEEHMDGLMIVEYEARIAELEKELIDVTYDTW